MPLDEMRMRHLDVCRRLGLQPLRLLERVECDLTGECLPGGYADVYKGTLDRKPIALKRPRIYADVTQSDKESIIKVRCLIQVLRFTHLLFSLVCILRSLDWGQLGPPQYPQGDGGQ